MKRKNWKIGKQLRRRFGELCCRIVALTGSYQKDVDQKQMQHAVTFWSGLRRLFSEYRGVVGLEDRVEFLADFINRKNPRVSLIAKIESLPDQVWRRVLWHYDIDFMSPESFLRRITPEQIQGINEAYVALFAGDAPRLPTCFTDGWKNRLRRWFRIIETDPERLLKSGYGTRNLYPEDRYDEKGAFAFEFFHSDFGFAKYLREEDDEVIAPVRWARTLGTPVSLRQMTRYMFDGKLEKSAFYINRQDGIYEYMYQLSRSNYIWFPNRTVEGSKSHPCSEIWLTWFIWALFFIISPIFTIFTVSLALASASLLALIPVGVVGLFTPLALFYAGLKYLFLKAKPHIEAALGEIDEGYFDTFGRCAVVAVVGFVVAFVGLLLLFLAYHAFWGNLLLTGFLALFLLAYVALIVHEDEPLLPWQVRVIGIPAVVMILSRAIFEWYSQIIGFFGWIFSGIVSGIVAAFNGVIYYVASYWLELIVLPVPFMVLGFFTYWSFTMSSLEEEYLKDSLAVRAAEKVWKAMLFLMWSFVIVSLGVSYWALFVYGVENLNGLALVVVLYLLVQSGLFLMNWFKTHRKRKPQQVFDYRKKFANIRNAVGPSYSVEEVFVEECCLNSTVWNAKDPAGLIRKLMDFLQRNYHFDYDVRRGVNYWRFPSSFFYLSEQGFALLDEYQELLEEHHMMRGDRDEIAMYIARGYSAKKAWKLLQELEHHGSKGRAPTGLKKVLIGLRDRIVAVYVWVEDLWLQSRLWRRMNKEFCPGAATAKEVKH